MRHIIIPLAIGSGIIALLVATGQGEFSAGTFTLDPKDAGISPFSQPANANPKTTNR